MRYASEKEKPFSLRPPAGRLTSQGVPRGTQSGAAAERKTRSGCNGVAAKGRLKFLYSRVAISNHRLVALQDGQVTFRFKDYKRRGELRNQTLDAVEFLRRFVLHVLPRGLHKIRYFGLLANCHRHAKLAHCRILLGPTTQRLKEHEMISNQAGSDGALEVTWVGPGDSCPVCHKGRMQLVETFHRHRAVWDLSVAVPGFDTS